MIAFLLAAVLAAPDPAPADSTAGLADLQRVYQQSCAERAYGSYNDMCDQMRRQIRSYQRSLPSRPKRTGSPTTVGTPALAAVPDQASAVRDGEPDGAPLATPRP